jgi:hypothetical protein
MRRLLLAFFLLYSSAAAAANLQSFLRSATRASSARVALRADGPLVSTGTEGTVDDQVVLLRNEDGATYLELRRAALRILIRPDKNEAYEASGRAAAKPLPMDRPIAGTDFSPEDLKPFVQANFDSAAIADRNDRQITVSLDPRDSQYTLIVTTFDVEKHVPVKTMYYTETLNNLTKMRLDQDLVDVAGHWLPSTIIMRGFKLRTSSKLTLTWKTADQLDSSRFDPAAFAQAPPMQWPE